MKILLTTFALILVSLNTVSCVSYLALEDSIKQEKHARAIQIRATTRGDTVGIEAGIDVTSWEAIKAHPIKSVVAAAADVGTIFAAVKGIESLTDNSSHSSTKTKTVNESTTVNVNGDGNVTTVNRDNTSTTSTDTK